MLAGLRLHPAGRTAIAPTGLTRFVPVAMGLLVFSLAGEAIAGPLQLALSGDAGDFGLEESLEADPESRILAQNPATLGWRQSREGAPTTFLDVRFRQERTYRQSRRTRFTRVGTRGADYGLNGLVPHSSWRFAAHYTPGDSQYFDSRTLSERFRFRGDYADFQLAFGRRVSRDWGAGFHVSRSTLEAGLQADPTEVGSTLGSVTDFVSNFQDTTVGAQVHHSPSERWDARVGAGYVQSELNNRLLANPQDGVPGEALHLPAAGNGYRFNALLRHRPEPNIAWILQGEAQLREGSGRTSLNDGTDLGSASTRLKSESLRLNWIRSGPRHKLSLGAEHWRGSANFNYSTLLYSLFPDDTVVRDGRASALASARWSGTVARVGYQQQVTRRLQAKSGLGFGQISARVDLDAQAKVQLGTITSSYQAVESLGSRLGFFPALGVTYAGKRADIFAEVSQFVPLPKRKSGGAGPNPNPGPKVKSSTFGGNLLTVGLRYKF